MVALLSPNHARDYGESTRPLLMAQEAHSHCHRQQCQVGFPSPSSLSVTQKEVVEPCRPAWNSGESKRYIACILRSWEKQKYLILSIAFLDPSLPQQLSTVEFLGSLWKLMRGSMYYFACREHYLQIKYHQMFVSLNSSSEIIFPVASH